MKSKILDAVHHTATGLHKSGMITDVIMREFDKLYSPAKAIRTGRSSTATIRNTKRTSASGWVNNQPLGKRLVVA